MIDTETAKTYEYKLKDSRLIELYKNDSISIYDNDLKFKTYNNIDIKRVKDGKNEEDKDTLEYRIKECKMNNYKSLDLSHLGLKEIPQLPKQITNNLKYLFLNENDIEHIEDLSHFNDLLVLDLCNNKLTSLPQLPERLEELLIKNNSVGSIKLLSNNDYLKRLDCSNNLIKEIPVIDSLEVLRCDNNEITEIPKLVNIIKLSCSNNQIKLLNDMPNIEILDCDRNLVEIIENYKNLKELYCSKNNIEYVKNLNKIEILHCYKTNIRKLGYFQTLKELLCDSQNLMLSKFYTIVDSDIYKNSIVQINFK